MIFAANYTKFAQSLSFEFFVLEFFGAVEKKPALVEAVLISRFVFFSNFSGFVLPSLHCDHGSDLLAAAVCRPANVPDPACFQEGLQ